jgi:hypothetical protein
MIRGVSSDGIIPVLVRVDVSRPILSSLEPDVFDKIVQELIMIMDVILIIRRIRNIALYLEGDWFGKRRKDLSEGLVAKQKLGGIQDDLNTLDTALNIHKLLINLLRVKARVSGRHDDTIGAYILTDFDGFIGASVINNDNIVKHVFVMMEPERKQVLLIEHIGQQSGSHFY